MLLCIDPCTNKTRNIIQINSFQEIIQDIEGVEALIAQVNSLQHKLGANDDSKEFTSFLIQLMRGKEVNVPGGSRGNIGSRITTMFRNAQKVLLKIYTCTCTSRNILI